MRGTGISREPICCAVSVHHRLAKKDKLAIQDLYGEKLMLIKRDWSHYVDLLRDELWKNHPQIQIIDFDFYNTEVFNQCENNNCILMAVPKWQYVHPCLRFCLWSGITQSLTVFSMLRSLRRWWKISAGGKKSGSCRLTSL